MAQKIIVQTKNAPEAIGPYSQGVGFGGLFFFSGQIPFDPQTNKIVDGGIDIQTRQVMANLQAVLTAAGLDFSHVLKTTIYLKNLSDFSRVNTIYGAFFDENPPARACVEVSRLPQDVLIEIDMIAAAPTDEEPQK